MKNNRIKKPIITLASREEAEAAVNELAQAVNTQRKFLSQRDAEILAINKKYEGGLSACDMTINSRRDALHTWAEANPDQFPDGRKSLDLVSGVIGFRTGTPKLALLNRRWNWDIVEVALQLCPNWIRQKTEVNKEAILADHSSKATSDAELATKGLKVVQEESFYVEPKLADTDARQTKEVVA